MKKQFFFLALLFALHLYLLTNLRFEAWPEMLVYPYLIKNGFYLYKDIINPYLPLFNWVLAGYFSIFAITVSNLKILTYFIILLSDYLIFSIAKKRFGTKAAFTALTFFITFQPLLDGNGLWYDLSLVPILLLAFDKKSPLLLSLAFFIKQSVFWLLPIFMRSLKKLTISLTLIFIIVAIPFLSNQTIHDYLFWAWQFPFLHFPSMPGHKDWGTFGLWVLAIFPLAVPILLKKKIRLNKDKPLLWMIASFMFIFPRFGLFHLQPALAFASLVLAQNIKHIKIKSIYSKILVTCNLLLVTALWSRHLKLFWHQPTRFFEPQIIEAAKLLESNTKPDEALLFLNSPDQLMVLSNRLPTKPWAITFPWYLETSNMQTRFINALSDQQVKTIVFSPFQDQGKYVPGSYIPHKLNQVVQTRFTNAKMLPANIFLLTFDL